MFSLARTNRKKRLGLEGRFMLSFAIIVTTLMALVILFVEKHQSANLMGQTQMRGVAVGKSIAAVCKNALLNYDYVSLQQAAETATRDEGVVYVIILNKEGIVAGHSGQAAYVGQRIVPPLGEEKFARDGIRIHSIEQSAKLESGGSLLDIAVPVRVEGSDVVWGTIHLGLSVAELNEMLSRTRAVLILLGALAVAVVLFSARILSRMVTQPIANLAAATAAVARGDLEQSVDENLFGELGDLATSFNKMTNDLRTNREEIRNHNQLLENTVQRRTAALHEKAAQLQQANEELKALDRLKGDFLSNVSHELRTPLTSIRSFTEILSDPEQDLDQDERTEFLSIISEQTDRLTRLISDLLDLSKLEAGQFHCDMEEIELSVLLENAVNTMRTLAEEKDICLNLELVGPLPRVQADRDRLDQVLVNLMGNAIKFTPSGGSIEVRVSSSSSRHRRIGAPKGQNRWTDEFTGLSSEAVEADGYIVVEVHDTGPGIPFEDQQRIFEKFGQVGNIMTDKPQGTGLGLAISGNIVLQHRGALWVESAPGVGSVFAFSIPSGDLVQSVPRGHPTRDEIMKKASNELVAALDDVSEGRNVLVVDDEADIVTGVVELLTLQGYRASGCCSGGQAVSQARKSRPDAIILDIMMPDLDGYDVLKLLKSYPETRSIPVIVMSVLDDHQISLRCGASKFIQKPFMRAGMFLPVQGGRA